MMTIAFTALRGALVLALALVTLPLLRRASAATRRTILVFAFAAVAVLPIASAILPPLHVAGAAEPDAVVGLAPSSLEPVSHAGGHAEVALKTTPAPAIAAVPDASRAPSATSVVLAVWALGALAVLARFGVGASRARRLARGADLVEVRDGVELRVSSLIEAPAVTGVWSPVVLLPRASRTWSDERRRLVLMHELAHVAQRDCLANVVAQVACALHWFDPLAWIAAKRLRIERELAADDCVLAGGARASSYAEHLLQLAVGDSIPSGALAMAEPSQVAVRIRAMLSSRPRAPLGLGWRVVLGASGAALAAFVACATPDRAVNEPTDAPVVKDASLQAIVDAETDKLVADWKTRAAVVIVIDPTTGNVLATAQRGPERAYVPGSTLKPFVVAAALDEHAIQPDQRFDGGNGKRAYGDRSIEDPSPHGFMDAREILAVSSNVGMTHVADALGGAKLAAWIKRFHFADPGPLDGYHVGVVAIGEREPATPMQVAAAFAALANGGVYHAPNERDAGERVVTEDTARRVVAMLESVVTGETATGKAARVEGVRVAGKTGTAQLEPGKEDGENYASFVGVAPIDHPRYVVLVGAEAPRDHGAGGQVAAPVFSRIVTRALQR